MTNEKRFGSRYIVKPGITTWISMILLLSILPLSMALPVSWGWENGPIEDMQDESNVKTPAKQRKICRSFTVYQS